eukprot:Sspe_Gene.54832::Locus_30217_Transcript_1_1_Confidence_1.000_Length_1356::g.54832::m.54832
MRAGGVRSLIRRKASFQRMDNLVEHVDEWFFSDDVLAQDIDNFAYKHCDTFYPHPSGPHKRDGTSGWYIFASEQLTIEQQNRMGEGMLLLKDYHGRFESLFEDCLMRFIESCRVSHEQFQEVFAISQQEERQSGRHFYRWIEAPALPQFLGMMSHTYKTQMGEIDSKQRPMEWLQERIKQLSEDARVTQRRRRALRPLLEKWNITDFKDLHDAIEHSDCPIKKLTKAQYKAIVKWRNRLLEPRLNSQGVYDRDYVDRDAWARYAGKVSEAMDEDEFDNFVAYLEGHVAKLPVDEKREIHLAVWEIFRILDQHYLCEADYQLLEQIIQSRDTFSTKAHKKVLHSWETKLKDSPDTYHPMSLADLKEFILNLAGKDVSHKEYLDTIHRLCRDVTAAMG